MSCFDCIHSQPTGCRLSRPEFETYADCDAFEMDSAIHTAEAFMAIFGFKRVEKQSSEISGSASSINVQKGDGDGVY